MVAKVLATLTVAMALIGTDANSAYNDRYISPKESCMELSEQERKLLEQLEASLKAEDPGFADTLSGRGQVRIHRRRAAIAGLAFVVGLAALLGGIQIHPAVSIAGFAVMLAGAVVGINSWQRVQGEPDPAQRHSDRTAGGGGSAAASRPSAPSSSQDFMERLEERWKKRQEGGEQP